MSCFSSTVLLLCYMALRCCLSISAFPKIIGSESSANSIDFKTVAKPLDTLLGIRLNGTDILDYSDGKDQNPSPKRTYDVKDTKKPNTGYIDMNVNATVEQNNKSRTKGSNASKEKAMRSFRETPIPIAAESNVHILQTNQNYDDATPGYNSNDNNVIVKQLGNTAFDSSQYQDKVIYVPVYESSNSGNGHGFRTQNSGQNTFITNTHTDANKKAVGFIGVVFVNKMQPEDAIGTTKGHNLNRYQNSVPNNGFQHTQTPNRDFSDNVQHKSPNSIILNDAFNHQAEVNGLKDETYQLQIQKTSGEHHAFVQQPPTREQWQNHNIQNNAWAMPQNIPVPPQIQRPVQMNHGKHWSNSNNQIIGSGQDIRMTQVNKHNSNSNSYNKGKNNFQSQRPIPENPLFPSRGNAIPKTIVISKSSDSKTPQTPVHNQKSAQEEYWANNNPQTNNNPQQIKSNQNFNPKIVNFQDLAQVIRVPDGKGSGQLIPVIKHVVLEKGIPVIQHTTFVTSNENNLNLGADNGLNQNHHLLQKTPHFATNSNNLGYDQTSHKNTYNDRKGQSVSNNGNFVPSAPSQEWISQLQNNQKSPNPQLLNNQNHPNQYRRNGGMPNNDPISAHVQTQILNPKTFQSFNKLDSNRNSAQHVLVQVPNIKSHNSAQQVKDTNRENPLKEEFSRDAQINEAFKVAGIYLQNHNDLSSLSVSTVAPQNKYPFINGNVEYSDEMAKSTNPTNDVKPTMDQRYNALFHERSNNLNVIKLRDHILRSKQNPNYAEHHNNEIKSSEALSHSPTSRGNIESLSQPENVRQDANFNRKSKTERNWRFIQNNQSPVAITSMDQLYAIDRSKNIINEPKVSHVQNLIIGNPNKVSNDVYNHLKQNQFTDSFQMKDAISHPQQQKFSYQKHNANQRNVDQEFYNAESAQVKSNPPTARFSAGKNDASVVFIGSDKDWPSRSHNDRTESGAHSQKQNRSYQGSYYKENNPKIVEQRPHLSEFSKPNGSQGRINNAWYQRDLKNKENKFIKRGEGGSGTSDNKDADGSDSNGFGGESFW